MIGFLIAALATAAALVTAALIVKRPPVSLSAPSKNQAASLGRWVAALGQTAQECKQAIHLPAAPDYPAASAWNLGAPVQPVDFSRQLASLQLALSPLAPAPKASPESKASVEKIPAAA